MTARLPLPARAASTALAVLPRPHLSLGPCAGCGKRVINRRSYTIVLDRRRGPRLMHNRCAWPLRLTRRGQAVLLVLAPAAAAALLTGCLLLAWTGVPR